MSRDALMMGGVTKNIIEFLVSPDDIHFRRIEKDPSDPIQAEKIRKAEEKRRRKTLKRLKDYFSCTKNVIEFLDRELGKSTTLA